MSTLADLLVINLGTRFTKLLVEFWLGKGATTMVIGDVADVIKSRIQSAADQKKAKREFEELGDRMARELLPLFERAEMRNQVNVEAVVLALGSTLDDSTSTEFLVQKDLDSGAILRELRKNQTKKTEDLSQPETELYERTLDRLVRQLVEIASRLPNFKEHFAARSLQQLSRITVDIEQILERVRHIEAIVSPKNRYEREHEHEVDYRLAVQRNLDYMEIFGIDLPPESRAQKLSVAYISLNIETQSGDGSESLSAEALFDSLDNQQGRLVIRGDAGTGKSTLLRWAAMTAAGFGLKRSNPRLFEPIDGSEPVLPWRSRVPFLILLRQCRTGALPRPDEFPEMVARSLDQPVGWVRSLLKRGRAIVLLDGVDEIPNSHRETTRRSIKELVLQYPGTLFVVSTRPSAVDPDWLIELGFREARINPLSDLDRERLIDRWHVAVSDELRERGKNSNDMAATAASLKRQITNSIDIARLATNPLLCAMICALHRDRKQNLPTRQRQLCEDLCHALLHRREQESGLDLAQFPEPYRRLDYPQKRAVVQELAHHMVLNEYSSVPVSEATEQIGRVLTQFAGHSVADSKAVTLSLVERSGILREEKPGEISFIHNAFKELLAGDFFANASAAGMLASHALNPTWQPVILFSVATDQRGFASKVIRRILQTSSTASELRARQILALRCWASALYTEEELSSHLQEIGSRLFPPRTMEDAEALAAGGNATIPFLANREGLSSAEAAANIRTLRLIGTPEARLSLLGYFEDRRPSVIAELAQAVEPLEIEWVKEQLLAGESLPEGIRSQIKSLLSFMEKSMITNLDLSRSQVSDLSWIAECEGLECLDLSESPVSNISALSKLYYLERLYLGGTRVRDLSPLAELGNLEYLDLSGTLVTDLSPLAKCRNLEGLYLRMTKVIDLSPLRECKKLKYLDLERSRVPGRLHSELRQDADDCYEW